MEPLSQPRCPDGGEKGGQTLGLIGGRDRAPRSTWEPGVGNAHGPDAHPGRRGERLRDRVAGGLPVKLRRPAGVLTPGCQSRPTGRPRRRALAGYRPSATKPPNTDPRRDPVLDALVQTVAVRPPKRSRRARRSECACARLGSCGSIAEAIVSQPPRPRSGRRNGPLVSAGRSRADRRSDRLAPAVASACPRRNGCGCDRRNGREQGAGGLEVISAAGFRNGLEAIASVPGLRWSLRAGTTLRDGCDGTKAVVHESRVGDASSVHEFPPGVDRLWIGARRRQTAGRAARAGRGGRAARRTGRGTTRRHHPPRANISTFGNRSVAALRSSE